MAKQSLQQLMAVVRAHQDKAKVLDLSNQHLNDNTLIPLAQLVANNKNIQHINLSFNEIGDRGIAHLAKASQLRTINLRANRICNQGLNAFFGNQTIESLILDLNMNIGEHTLIELINRTTRLQQLKILACQVSSKGKEQISALLKERTITAIEEQAEHRSFFLKTRNLYSKSDEQIN